jgi:hypothetical protein
MLAPATIPIKYRTGSLPFCFFVGRKYIHDRPDQRIFANCISGQPLAVIPTCSLQLLALSRRDSPLLPAARGWSSRESRA